MNKKLLLLFLLVPSGTALADPDWSQHVPPGNYGTVYYPEGNCGDMTVYGNISVDNRGILKYTHEEREKLMAIMFKTEVAGGELPSAYAAAGSMPFIQVKIDLNRASATTVARIAEMLRYADKLIGGRAATNLTCEQASADTIVVKTQELVWQNDQGTVIGRKPACELERVSSTCQGGNKLWEAQCPAGSFWSLGSKPQGAAVPVFGHGPLRKEIICRCSANRCEGPNCYETGDEICNKEYVTGATRVAAQCSPKAGMEYGGTVRKRYCNGKFNEDRSSQGYDPHLIRWRQYKCASRYGSGGYTRERDPQLLGCGAVMKRSEIQTDFHPTKGCKINCDFIGFAESTAPSLVYLCPSPSGTGAACSQYNTPLPFDLRPEENDFPK
ncbi:MAG: hypothetical protein Q8P84_07845 [Deltaproteobacteria bacterium]|nr:hypothetical protein [Deltaproteobacteria bacterium]